MPLLREIDERISKRFDDLIKDGNDLLENSGQEATESGRFRVTHFSLLDFNTLATSVRNLIRQVVNESTYRQISKDIQDMESAALNAQGRTVYNSTILYATTTKIVGVLIGLKRDYESGMLDNLAHVIETNVTSDFMSQAEELLGGKRHDYDHVPAAVLAGAVLEDALRRLCQRQEPPIKTEFRGKPKMLDRLISDLSNAKVFENPLAAELRSWAAIRNSAAHGRFKEFDRDQVEQMIRRMKPFLVDYL